MVMIIAMTTEVAQWKSLCFSVTVVSNKKGMTAATNS
jgi:hypothetical protein